MSIDFSQYPSAYGRSLVKEYTRATALRLLQKRFRDAFTDDHRTRVAAATARQVERIIHNFGPPGVGTLDEILAPLRTAPGRKQKR